MRLIDADELSTVTDIREDGAEFTYIPYSEIEEAATAYDVDKVMKKLEENSSNFSKSYKVGNNTKYHKVYKAIKLNKAIEIVKAGKING